MRSGTITLTIMSAGLGLLLLAAATAGCPHQAEQTAATTTPAHSASAATPQANDAPAPPAPDQASTRKVLTPPYLTISALELPAEAKLVTGQTVTAYWELPAALPAPAWLGLIPVATPAVNQASRDAALIAEDLAGRTKAMLSYQILQPGTYVWRMFTGDTPEGQPYLESEVFEVIPSPASQAPAK